MKLSGVALLLAVSLNAHAQTRTLTQLCSFPSNVSGVSQPGSLIQGKDGNLYGSDQRGGLHGSGSVFQVQPGVSNAYTNLYSFGGRDPHDVTRGGDYPSDLTLGSDGNFYGATFEGGPDDLGTIFKITPAGTLTTLYRFGSNPSDGARPSGKLLLGSDGYFYGTTSGGGAHGGGTIFKMAPAGALTVLYSFSDSPAASSPYAGLVQDAGGNFYGTTNYGGTQSSGTVYKFTPGDGTLTVLHSFTSVNLNNVNQDGTQPESAVVIGKDGNLYGTTYDGGTHGGGVVYKVTPTGTFTTLHSFSPGTGDGYNPFAALTLGTDGLFYGTTIYGGANDEGTVFQIRPAGTVTILYSFSTTANGGINVDGSGPLGTLLQTPNGNFYGTTFAGGVNGYGTAFMLGFVPKITSASTASGVVGQPFSFQVTATNSPTRFTATALPQYLHINAATGLISGTFPYAATWHPTITVYNRAGSDQQLLTITIKQKATPPAGGTLP